jgi:hypothetical protein
MAVVCMHDASSSTGYESRSCGNTLLLLLLGASCSSSICLLLLLLLCAWRAAVLLVSVVCAESAWLQVAPVDECLAGKHDPSHQQHAHNKHLHSSSSSSNGK